MSCQSIRNLISLQIGKFSKKKYLQSNQFSRTKCTYRVPPMNDKTSKLKCNLHIRWITLKIRRHLHVLFFLLIWYFFVSFLCARPSAFIFQKRRVFSLLSLPPIFVFILCNNKSLHDMVSYAVIIYTTRY